MGMFDTIVIEGLKLGVSPEIRTYLKAAGRELPNDFQTKDLDNTLATYYIDSRGQMYVEHHVATGKKIKQDNFWSKWIDNRAFLEKVFLRAKNKTLFSKSQPRLVPEFKKIKKKYNGTHTFNFYTYEEIAGRYVDFEYKAETVNGKIKKIEPVRFKIENTSAAKKRRAEKELFDKKMQESFEARKRFTSTWYYPILREIYNPLVFVARNAVQWICQKLVNWSYKWQGI
ncbi:MAG: hypothetical protein EBU90_18390 [Proteobacteria bacterium]|nr:hypothetical protein [Pseudomonadota bacterium]NBP13041.1 hypothetical protein [bacterium]